MIYISTPNALHLPRMIDGQTVAAHHKDQSRVSHLILLNFTLATEYASFLEISSQISLSVILSTVLNERLSVNQLSTSYQVE